MLTHLTEPQATVSAVPTRKFPVHALLVLLLQLMADSQFFLACRENICHRGNSRGCSRCALPLYGVTQSVFWGLTLTGAKVWGGLVVADDQASGVFLLKKQKHRSGKSTKARLTKYNLRLVSPATTSRHNRGEIQQHSCSYSFSVNCNYVRQHPLKLTLAAPISRRNFCFLSSLPRSADCHWVGPSCQNSQTKGLQSDV